jgi:hypothetical protein
MRPEIAGALYDGGIPICFGVLAALLGYRVIGPKSGSKPRWDEWHSKWGRVMKLCGLVLVVFGAFFVVRGLVFAP